MGLTAKNKKEKYDKIHQSKKTTTLDELCKGYPESFIEFGKYVRGLSFEEKPDYAYCRKLFVDQLWEKGLKYDYEYDWVVWKSSKKDQENSCKESKEEKPTAAEVRVSSGFIHPSKPMMAKD